MKLSFLPRALARHSRSRGWLAGSAIVALSIAGAAIAASSPVSTTAVNASFTATTVSNRSVQTCTGSDGTYELTRATFAGTATSSDPHLNGPITLDVSSVYNTVKTLGWIKAEVRIESSTPGDGTTAKLTAVDNNGTVQGFLVGDGHGNGVTLLANLTGSFTGAGGFTTGSIGTGSATDTAIITSGSCDVSNDDDSGESDSDNGSSSGGQQGSSGVQQGSFGAPHGSIGSPHGLKGPGLGRSDD
jgi:hypothetical protein